MRLMKLILQEDDCAPDARQSFDEKMKSLLGVDSQEFIELAKATNGKSDSDDEMTMVWRINNHRLEYSVDNPFMELYKLED